MRLALLLSTVAAVVVVAAGLVFRTGTSRSSAPSGPATRSDRVKISDFKFQPASIEVKRGARVAVTNDDTAKHTLTSKSGGAFDTGAVTKGQTKTIVLKKAGTYSYFCSYHAFMTGKIKVDP